MTVKDLETGGTHYELYGIITHFGTMTGGHYTAFVKSPHENVRSADPNYKDQWFYFDDDRVSIIDNMERYMQEDKKLHAAAYVFFYRQKNLEFKPHKFEMEFLNKEEGGGGEGTGYRFPKDPKANN